MISVEPIPLEHNQFSTITIADLLGYPWIPEWGRMHLKKLMAWFVFASVVSISFLESLSEIPILFSFTLLLAIGPFAIWTWLSLRCEIVKELLGLFEVWFMILNFMGYSFCSNVLLQHDYLKGLHVFLDMIYFIMLVPLFSLLDALPNDFLHKFKVIYGFNSLFLGMSMIRLNLASYRFEPFPFLGITISTCRVTSVTYSSAGNLIAFLLNNLYMSYKHPNAYVLWRVGMKECRKNLRQNTHNMPADVESNQLTAPPKSKQDTKRKRIPSVQSQVTGNKTETKDSLNAIPTSDHSVSSTDVFDSAEEESGSDVEEHSRSKTVMGFVAVTKRRMSRSYRSPPPDALFEHSKRSSRRDFASHRGSETNESESNSWRNVFREEYGYDSTRALSLPKREDSYSKHEREKRWISQRLPRRIYQTSDNCVEMNTRRIVEANRKCSFQYE